MADSARDPDSLEREIERTRDELARTIDEIAERVNPRNVAIRGVARLKEETGQLTAAVGAMLAPSDPEDRAAVARRNTAIMIGSGVLLGVAVVALWSGRRRRRR